jgi:hypothetical protein
LQITHVISLNCPTFRLHRHEAAAAGLTRKFDFETLHTKVTSPFFLEIRSSGMAFIQVSGHGSNGPALKEAALFYLDVLIDLEVDPTICQLQTDNDAIVFSVSPAEKEKALKHFRKKKKEYRVTEHSISKEPQVYQIKGDHSKVEVRFSAQGGRQSMI